MSKNFAKGNQKVQWKKTWSIYPDENKENIQQTGNLSHTYKFFFLFFFLHSPDCPPTCLSHCLCVRIVSKGRELAERSHAEWFSQNGTNSQPGLFGPFFFHTIWVHTLLTTISRLCILMNSFSICRICWQQKNNFNQQPGISSSRFSNPLSNCQCVSS